MIETTIAVLLAAAKSAPELAAAYHAVILSLVGMTPEQREKIDADYQTTKALRKEHFPTE